MDVHKLFITGAVNIAATKPLADTAESLGAAIGVRFLQDEPGRYDEFPSYTANGIGLRFALLGIPHPNEQISDEPITNYCLQISPCFTPKEATERSSASAYFAELIAKKSDLTVLPS